MKLEATVLGTEALVARIQKMNVAFREEMRRSMTRAMISLQQVVKFQKLSGDPLKNRTGTLRRSINWAVKDQSDAIVGSVGTNISYGRVHELGLTVTVPAQVRMITQAWGRKLKEPKTVTVKPYTAKYPVRSFLASSFKQEQTSIFAELNEGAARAMKKG